MNYRIVIFVCLFGIHAAYANRDDICDAPLEALKVSNSVNPAHAVHDPDSDPFDMMITEPIVLALMITEPTVPAWPTCSALCPAFFLDPMIEFVPEKFIPGALPNLNFFDLELSEKAGRGTSGAEIPVETDFMCNESGLCELVKDFHLDSPRLTRRNQERLQKPKNGHKAMPISKISITDSKPSKHDSQVDRHHYVQESVTDPGQEGNSSTGPTPGLSRWSIINPLMIGDILMTIIWIAFCYFFALPTSNSGLDEEMSADYPASDEPHNAPPISMKTYLFELYRLNNTLNQLDEVVILNKIKDKKKQLKQKRKEMKREVSDLLRRVERLTQELNVIRDKKSVRKISSLASEFTISFVPNFLRRVYVCSKDKFIKRTMKVHNLGPGSSVDPA